MIITPNRRLKIPEGIDQANLMVVLKESFEKLDAWEKPENIPYTNLQMSNVTNIKTAIEFLLNNVPEIPGAGYHNSIYRGKNIQDKFTDGSLYTAIADGSFKDLYIGDYFDITITTEYGTEKVRCLLAGFDCYWGCGDTALFTHHAVIVPLNAFATTHYMNPTNTTEGSYTGSEMYKTILPKYEDALVKVFGDKIIQHRELFSTATNPELLSMAGNGWKGASTDPWIWFDNRLRLLGEIEVYGSMVFSSSYHDVAIANKQLPLFSLNPSMITCGLGGPNYASVTERAHWRLSAVASVTHFAHVGWLGGSAAGYASDLLGVRPRFLIS